MKILSSTLYEFLSYDDNVGNEKGPPIAWNKTLWKSITCLVTDILQNIFFCVQQKKKDKFIHILVGKFSCLGELFISYRKNPLNQSVCA